MISDKRNHLAALSRELSLLWSHRRCGGNRKPEGGGPAGVAARRADDEKAAVEIRGKTVRTGETEMNGAGVAQVRDNIVRDFA